MASPNGTPIRTAARKAQVTRKSDETAYLNSSPLTASSQSPSTTSRGEGNRAVDGSRQRDTLTPTCQAASPSPVTSKGRPMRGNHSFGLEGGRPTDGVASE